MKTILCISGSVLLTFQLHAPFTLDFAKLHSLSFLRLGKRKPKVVLDLKFHFYTPPHDNGGVLWFHVGRPSVSCTSVCPSIFHFRMGVQLILAYSWARPAILVAGKGRGGMFLFLLFLHFHSCSSFFPVPLFYLFYCLFYLFSPFLWETTQNDPQGLTCR